MKSGGVQVREKTVPGLWENTGPPAGQGTEHKVDYGEASLIDCKEVVFTFNILMVAQKILRNCEGNQFLIFIFFVLQRFEAVVDVSNRIDSTNSLYACAMSSELPT